MTSGAVVLGRTLDAGQRVTTYMPGVVLGVDVIPPSTPGDQLSGLFAAWRVNVLTRAGWEQVHGWASNLPDAEARAREYARRIIDMATDPEQPAVVYLDPIEAS